MKPIAIVVGSAALLGAASQGYAVAEWDGGGAYNYWSTVENWVGDAEPGATEAVVISDNTSRATCVYNSTAAAHTDGALTLGGNMQFNVRKASFGVGAIDLTGSADVGGDQDWNGASVTIDSATQGASMTLVKEGANTLTLSSDIQLIGSGTSYTATYRHIAGSLSNPLFDMDGGAGAGGEAVLDIDETLDLSDTDVDVSGYSDIEVEDGKTFTVEDLAIAAGTDYLRVYGGDVTPSNATFKYDSLTNVNSGTVYFEGPLTVECY